MALSQENVQRANQKNMALSQENVQRAKWLLPACLLGTAIAVTRFDVASPGHLLVRAGPSLFRRSNVVGSLKVGRSCFYLPAFQTVTCVPLQPRTINFKLKCMTSQFLTFDLPVAVTVSAYLPHQPSIEHEGKQISGTDLFCRYVERLHPLDNEAFHSVLGMVIHGETRSLAGTMNIEAIISDRAQFAETIVNSIQNKLWQYGLSVDSANVAEVMEDGKLEHSYLHSKAVAAQAEAFEQSRAAAARSEKRGKIQIAMSQNRQRRMIAALNADAVRVEVENKKREVDAEAKLNIARIQAERAINTSKNESDAAVQKQAAELQAIVAKAEAEKKLEEHRSNLVSLAKAQADAACILANAKAYEVERTAQAARIVAEQKALGDVSNFKAQADGTLSAAIAHAEGTKALAGVCGDELIPILQLKDGVPQKLAEELAKALQNMQPQIVSVQGQDPLAALAGMFAGAKALLNPNP